MKKYAYFKHHEFDAVLVKQIYIDGVKQEPLILGLIVNKWKGSGHGWQSTELHEIYPELIP